MTDAASLAARLPSLRRARVLVIGDVMLDRYVEGAVERMSPEAPIPVVRVGTERSMPGGAGNVARNIAALGAQAMLVGLVGDDEGGAALRQSLADTAGIEVLLAVESGRSTTVKTRYLAGRQQLLRADIETTAPASPAAAEELLRLFSSVLPRADVVVFSDYAKGALGDAVLRPAIARAKAAGKPVIVDPKSRNAARYGGADVLTPNRQELAAAAALEGDGDDASAAAALALTRGAELGAVLVTRGEKGMTLVEAGGKVRHLPAEAREVFDVSGAGDTVVATLAAAMAVGFDLEDAAALANVAAGIVVGKAGTAVVHPADLAGALQAQAFMTTEAKVVSAESALERVERWRARGSRIGFTNGCFDLIHPGHVALLAQARAACDRLVVGLNTDESVRRLKGPDRPIQNETARAIVLASLGAVDLVVPFAEDTPLELIRALRPDVLVKGADYRLDQVVGADVVQGYGGRVLLAKVIPGHSTTGTIGRMGRGGAA
jgi:D-beta-D-heptose 7-phosphate kinase / D-beta-D-heptose 1-phosphate adenosyltransferase